MTQKDGTEPAFGNGYWDNTTDGIYVDVVSGEPLFSSLEADAARVAESLGLLTRAEIDQRVARALPPGVSPEASSPAVEDARMRVLADAALVEDMVRQQLGPDASPDAVRRARGMGYTLLSTQDEAFREQRLVGLPDRLAP